jgi:hypothetical protein
MACTLPLKWLGLRRVPSAAPGMLNHTPRAFFRQTKTTHYCRRARRSSGVNDVGAGKSAVTDNIRCKRIANFRHGHDHALDVRPKSEPLGCAMSPSGTSRDFLRSGGWSPSAHSGRSGVPCNCNRGFSRSRYPQQVRSRVPRERSQPQRTLATDHRCGPMSAFDPEADIAQALA